MWRFPSLAAVLIGVLTLAGWVYDIEVFKRIYSGAASMKVNTALGCMLLGCSLLLGRVNRALAMALACLAALLAGLTLAEYGIGIDLGIDQALIADGESLHDPGRMAPATAFSILLLGFGAMALLGGHILAGQALALPAGALSTLAIVGYANGAESLYELSPFSSCALHTAIAVALLTISLLSLEPHKGFMNLFNSDSMGSVSARRLLPPAFAAPPVLSWLGRIGERNGLYDNNMAAVMVSLAMMMAMCTIIYAVALKLHRVDLDKRRALLAEAASARRLRHANAELQQFAYSVSHDIRGPLATILGLARLADDDIRTGDLPEACRSLAEIERSTVSLVRLVEDTLDLTRTDFVGESSSMVSVALLAQEVQAELLGVARKNDIELKLDTRGDAIIRTEPTRLKCVLRNLVENAIKYHDRAKAPCWVRVAVQGDAEAGVRIEIADNGLGIPVANQKDVFTVYRRFHPEAADGSGIGLALVRRQTACLGGSVSFHSSAEGTTFNVWLPPEHAAEITGEPPVPAPAFTG